VSEPSETLEREAAQRSRAGIAAIIAALVTLGGGIAASLIYSDFPHVLLIEAVRASAGLSIGRPGLRTAQVLFYDDNATALLISAIALAIGALALIGPLTYLYQAAKARRPTTPNVGLVMAVAGPVALAVSELVLQIDVMTRAHDFAGAANHGTAAAHDVLKGGLIVAAQILRQVAVIALGFAFVVIALNAMRAGLLTRFMGFLGIIVGVLFVIPIGSQLPVVQTFWLFAAGVLILDRWPGGRPPAWASGKAEPWPTQQELKEARMATSGAGPTAAGDEEPEERPQALRRKQLPEGAPASAPHSASKKKKRRR
jgi:hypothetical protein